MKFQFFSLLIFLVCSFAKAQEDSLQWKLDSAIVLTDSLQTKEKGRIWQNLKYDAFNIAGGTLNGFTQPVRWQKEDWIKAGATVAGLTLLYLADEETSDFFQKQSDDVPVVVKEFGWIFGRPEANYSLTSGIYLFGLITDNERIRETGVLLVTSSVLGGIAQQTMKTVVGRGRPHLNKGQNQFKLFKGGQDYGSFPSGHTILSTTTIYALSKQFDNWWIKGGLYGVGLITPVSRLWAGAHWLTDVTLSLVMSVAIVEGVESFLIRNKKYGHEVDEFGNRLDSNKKLKWNLTLGAGQIGFVGNF
jgi:hypothetical protein